MLIKTLSLGPGLRAEVAALSDVGCVRKNNEDSFAVIQNEETGEHLLLVADGMGGAAAGEVASRLTVETITRTFGASNPDASVPVRLQTALQLANQAVYEHAVETPEYRGMGTTCTAVVVGRGQALIAHVGDSRAYLLSTSGLTRLTVDHTLATELEQHHGDADVTIPRQANNILTRCLGVGSAMDIDTHGPMGLQNGDRLLVCSDGLNGMVSDDVVERALRRDGPAEACRSLVEAAKGNGGVDNITVVVAEIHAVAS